MISTKTETRRIATLFGTRPEAIKLAPVIHRLEERRGTFEIINITSSQHRELLYPFIEFFQIRVHRDLQVMRENQSPDDVFGRTLTAMGPLLEELRPDLLLVQGDTTTAVAGALAAFHRHIPVGHIEAGLRSGDPVSPFPEEMNRRLITRLATFHFAATPGNRRTLLSEGIPDENVFLTGNPGVDALKTFLHGGVQTATIDPWLRKTEGLKRIVLTAHRRESFGEVMTENLKALRRFVEQEKDVAMIFPVHLNPKVMRSARDYLSGSERIHLLPPLGYGEFIALLKESWLIVSDSGGIQEEAPTLGKPLLILRENTERPEVVEGGMARLVGNQPGHLTMLLEEAYQKGSWAERVTEKENPFGRGDSGERIARILETLFEAPILEAALADH